MNHVQEMVTFDTKDSELPTVVWANDGGVVSNHSKYYIKVLPKNPRATTYRGVELSIEDEPMFRNPITKDFNLNSWEVESIKQWVKENKELLRRVCDKTLKLNVLKLQPAYKSPKNKIELRSMRAEQARISAQTNAQQHGKPLSEVLNNGMEREREIVDLTPLSRAIYDAIGYPPVIANKTV